MTPALPNDILQSIEVQLSTGAYRTHDEVLRDALKSLELRKKGQAKIKEMLAVAETDIAAGRVGEFDREAIKRDVAARLAKQGVTK